MAHNPEIARMLMSRDLSKYRIWTTKSPWSGKPIWMAAAPYNLGRPFDTWAQAAHHLDRVHGHRVPQYKAIEVDGWPGVEIIRDYR